MAQLFFNLLSFMLNNILYIVDKGLSCFLIY